MSARMRAVFDSLNARGETALIPFVMAGDPDFITSGAILEALPAAGADIVELGIPFSDPMADGPDIQAAGKRALDAGMSLEGVFRLAEAFRSSHADVPLVLMGYYNPILQYGPERFALRCREAGVDGIIVVDLPPEEKDSLHPLLHAQDVGFIRLIAPTTDDERLERLVSDADGFVYTIAVKGITGSSSSSRAALEERIATIRQFTKLPVVAGFGIKTAAQVAELQGVADGIVVGSALVKAIAEAGPDGPIVAATNFLKKIANR